MWDSQRLTTLWASTACYRDSFYHEDVWAGGGTASRRHEMDPDGQLHVPAAFLSGKKFDTHCCLRT
jgi:hypothetical protein